MVNETDRELLELSAKAAGADWVIEEDGRFEILSEIGGTSGYWNPLSDDGDALRLAVKLRLMLSSPGRVDAWAQYYILGNGWATIREPRGDDPYAAARRAIVRAAAEIGRTKP